jgi:hypothetical protein
MASRNAALLLPLLLLLLLSRIALLRKHALALPSLDLGHERIRWQLFARHDWAVLNLVGCASWVSALCVAVTDPTCPYKQPSMGLPVVSGVKATLMCY